MTERKKYTDYFAIDDKYYAAVTKQLIDEGKVSWKNFYPHESFVQLLQRVYEVLSGRENRSLWLQGAYGTGKSHAALTVKSLLEAPAAEVEEYFSSNGLSSDLCQKLLSVKEGKQLIVIHRIGSGDIHSEQNLILDVQDSVMQALRAHGIENHGEASLREAAQKWLADPAKRSFMGTLIKRDEYAWKFEDRDIDEVIRILQSDDDEKAAKFMQLLMQVSEDNGITALRLDAQGMARWLREIIRENHLAGILFIWDEFTEFFQNNRNSLTGFQTLAEVSESDPFYFLLVTHKAEGLFNSKADSKKILDRFVEPVQIVLPENMAFHLMARAMRKTTDAPLLEEWRQVKAELDEDLQMACDALVQSPSNQRLSKNMQLTKNDLLGIVPIHPYAALVLKHISVFFASNQRSMFDFIISNDEKAHAFKWFIGHFGPYDSDPLLTVDMLWDFFYVQGAKDLENTVRNVLDLFATVPDGQLSQKEQRVFKTVLLLQGLAQMANEDIEMLRPTARHLDLAFSGIGDEWPEHSPRAYASHLVQKGLLFTRMNGKETEYLPALSHGNADEIAKLKGEERGKLHTTTLVQSSSIQEAVKLPPQLHIRFQSTVLSADTTFTKKINELAQKAAEDATHFQIVTCFALTEEERERLEQLIEQAVKNPTYRQLLFLDAACMPLGKVALDAYIDARAYAFYYQKRDNNQSRGFEEQSKKILGEWKERISSGSFVLYTAEEPSGKQCANFAALVEALHQYDLRVYPYALERYNVFDTMYASNVLGLGAQCGIEQELQKQFRSSNKQMGLDETLFSGVWHVEAYWKDASKASLPIVKAKQRVEQVVADGFAKEGRVSLSDIVQALMQPKFGYLPCNFMAVALGFLLKEYAQGAFFWSNGSTSVVMDVQNLKKSIQDTLKQVQTPSRNFKELYIVEMSPQQISFLQGTQEIFHITKEQCGSVEQAQSCIRAALPRKKFPLWCLKSVLKETSLKTGAAVVGKAIDAYVGVAGNANAGNRTAASIAEELGQLFRDHAQLVQDLAALFTDEMILAGMRNYLGTYREGKLPALAKDIDDGGRYLEAVHKKFAEAANWVWNIETANDEIDAVILDYEIIKLSNAFVPPTVRLEDALREWSKQTRRIHIAFEALGQTAGVLAPLLEQLYQLKKNGSLAKQNKQKFYDLLEEQGEAYRAFYSGQFACFEEVAKAYLSNLSQEEAREVFAKFQDGLFTMSRTEYFDYVAKEVDRYQESQAKMKLHALWQEKTGTKSPRDWSSHFLTPILCMFDDDARNEMREIFHIVNETNPRKDEVERAMTKLSQADFFERLADKAARDECFIERVVGDDAFLLPSADEIREYLQKSVTVEPYRWLEDKTVMHKLDDWVKREYDQHGYEKALNFIDEMEVNELKRYLQKSLVNNTKFGIEILKDVMKNKA